MFLGGTSACLGGWRKAARKHLSFAKPFLQKEPGKHGVVIPIGRIDPNRREVRKLLGSSPRWGQAWWEPPPAPSAPLPGAEPLSALFPAGILFSLTVVGPGVGFMLGSGMLRFYVDIDKVAGGG